MIQSRGKREEAAICGYMSTRESGTYRESVSTNAGRRSGSLKIETGDRFVTDYEFIIFAEVLGVSMEWLAGKE